jgi:Uma2 family endonuclease
VRLLKVVAFESLVALLFCGGKSMVEIAHKYTLADYEMLPEGAPYQLIAGDFVMSPAPIPYHQKSVGRIYALLDAFVEEHLLGETFLSPIDVYFDESDAYQPDIIFIATQRLGIIGEKNIQGAPDIIVEVLSSNAKHDLVEKKDVYEASGVKEYWIVDPERKSIDVLENVQGKFGNEFRLFSRGRNGSGSVESKVLEGFAIELAYVFAPFKK